MESKSIESPILTRSGTRTYATYMDIDRFSNSLKNSIVSSKLCWQWLALSGWKLISWLKYRAFNLRVSHDLVSPSSPLPGFKSQVVRQNRNQGTYLTLKGWYPYQHALFKANNIWKFCVYKYGHTYHLTSIDCHVLCTYHTIWTCFKVLPFSHKPLSEPCLPP